MFPFQNNRPATLALSCLLGFGCLTSAACGDEGATEPDPSTPSVISPTFLQIEGDANEPLTGGESFSYTQADAVFTAAHSGGEVEFHSNGDEGWTGYFAVPDSLNRLTAGQYTDLTRYPFHDPAVGGLSWIGRSLGCNTLTGSFTIDSVSYNGDELISIAVRFVQYCDDVPHALRGSIYLNTADTTSPPGPVYPPEVPPV